MLNGLGKGYGHTTPDGRGAAQLASQTSASHSTRRPGQGFASLNRGRANVHTSGFLAYVAVPFTTSGTNTVTPFGTIDADRYPRSGRVRPLEQAATAHAARASPLGCARPGPGMDLFERNGVWPACAQATIEYGRRVARPRPDYCVWRRRGGCACHHQHDPAPRRTRAFGRCSGGGGGRWCLVCIDRLGRALAIPDEVRRVFGAPGRRAATSRSECRRRCRAPTSPAPSTCRRRHAGAVSPRFPALDAHVCRHQLATLSRVRACAGVPRVGDSGARPTAPTGTPDALAGRPRRGARRGWVRRRPCCVGLSMGGTSSSELLRAA